MIGAVNVDAIPARREENLSTHAVRAIVREEIGTFSPIGVVVVASRVI